MYKCYKREHKPPVNVDAANQVLASIQGTSILSCQGASTPLCSSTDNSNGNSVQLRRCRVRHVNIRDASVDVDADESSECLSLRCVAGVHRVTTQLENLEKSGNSKMVREKSEKMEKSG